MSRATSRLVLVDSHWDRVEPGGADDPTVKKEAGILDGELKDPPSVQRARDERQPSCEPAADHHLRRSRLHRPDAAEVAC
jgi:hypothetical protein